MKNYDELADEKSLQKTVTSLKEKGYNVIVVEKGADAFGKIKEIIPAGASTYNGASVTLEKIGLTEYLKIGKHPWNDLRGKIFAEKDPVKQARLRKEASMADYYMGSVHALAETGEFIVASNTGSQLAGIVFSASNLILVIATQKIVTSVNEGMKRLKEYVVPLEEKHMMDLYNVHTNLSKIVIFNVENKAMSKRKINIILVKEKLGF